MLKFLVDAFTGNLQAHARRRATIYGLAAIAALAGLAALAYALGALHVWVVARYDPIVASLTFGGAFLVIGMGFAIAALVVARRPPPPDPTAALTGALAPVALAILTQWMKPAAPAPSPARPAAEVDPEPAPTSAPEAAPTDHSATAASGAILAILPALLVGLLVGRKLRG